MRKKTNELYAVYGKMTYQELMETARGLREEGDHKGICELAKENGIDKDDVDEFLENKELDNLASLLMAALGRINVESAGFNIQEIMVDWTEYIRQQIVDSGTFAEALMNPKKNLTECFGKILEWSYKNSYPVDADIIKAAGIKCSNVKLGIPGMARVKKIIRSYYMEV